MLLLIFLAVTMANEYWETERVIAKPQPLSYATATLENIGAQFADVVLPDAGVRKSNTSTIIRIADSTPRPGIGSQLNLLKSFIEGDFADSIHADISVNITNVNKGFLQLRALDNFIYENGMNGSREVLLRPVANDSSTGATEYRINFTINEYRNKVKEFGWDAGGDINVTVFYTDKNGTEELFGPVDSDEENFLTITYGENETEWVKVNIGRLLLNGSRYDGALWMNMSNSTSAVFEFEVELPLQPSNASDRLVFPIPMNYSQGGVYKTMNASR